MKFKDHAKRGEAAEGETGADTVRDGRQLMQQDERRIEWFRARDCPTFDAADIVHVGLGWIGVERPMVPLPLLEAANAPRR